MKPAWSTAALTLGLLGAVGGWACRCDQPAGRIAADAAADARADKDRVGQLTRVEGPAEIERAGQVVPARVGAALQVGDLLRTGAAGAVRLAFANGQLVRLGERALLRLGRDADSSLELTVVLGDAVVEGSGDLRIATAHGPVRLASGGRVRISARADRTRYEVLVGRASLLRAERPASGDRPAGAERAELALAPGDGLSIAIGGSVLERYHIELGATEVEPIGQADPGVVGDPGDSGGAATAGRAEGAAAPRAPGGAAAAAPAVAANLRRGTPVEPRPVPGRSAPLVDAPSASSTAGSGGGAGNAEAGLDALLAAGENATIHAERAPVLLALRLPPDCPASTASLRGLPGRATSGLGPGADPTRLQVRLGLGRFRYQLRCAGKTTARGTLTVRGDTGSAMLPRTPPQNRLEADGRRYTVLFQNLLPGFALSWPKPAGPGPYVLHLQTRGQTRQLAAPRALLELRSGAVPEGEHTWWFTSAEGRRSPSTSLVIRFDNAATAAEIQQPRPHQAGMPSAGRAPSELEVAGTTLLGSRVTVAEQVLPIDAQGRFRAQVALPPPDIRALAIRIEHRRSGIHYYLRRLRGR